MSYGERRGVNKLPGEYNLADMIGFGLAGAVGIVIAIIADMYQSDDASALFTISRWFSFISEMVGIGPLPLYVVILIMMGIGAAAVYYFQPVTMQAAFAQGFGVLAAVMTMAPSDLGTPLEAPDMPQFEEEAEQSAAMQAGLASYVGNVEGMAMRGSLSQPAVYTAGLSTARVRTVAFQEQQDVKYNLSIEILLPEGLKESPERMIRKGNMRGKLHNDDSGQTWNVFRNSGALIQTASDNRRITIMTSIPGTGSTASLKARIEIDGYRIASEDFSARAGVNNTWQISMSPSGTPLFMQRLNQSYDF